MIKADYNHKNLIVEMLTKAFDTNKSVNYVVKQDKKRIERIKKLVEYSFDVCYLFGDILLSDDKKASALILYPDKKKTTLKTILLDIKLAFLSIGISRVKKVLDRESRIKKFHPKEPFCYIWFIGVNPENQNKGIGSVFIQEIIKESISKKRPIYLETSAIKNLPWYKKFGFEIYRELDFNYKLFLIKRGLKE